MDLFGKLAEACQRKGIVLTPYLNGGISSAEGVAHREWTTVSFDGREYRDPHLTPLQNFYCICPVCIKEMKERGIDYTNTEEVGKFSEFSALRMAKDI